MFIFECSQKLNQSLVIFVMFNLSKLRTKSDAVYRVDIVYVSSPSKTLDRQSEDAPMADKHTDGVTENKPSKNRSSAKSYQADNDSDCFSLSSMGTELSDDSDDGNDANQTVNDGPGKKRLSKVYL